MKNKINVDACLGVIGSVVLVVAFAMMFAVHSEPGMKAVGGMDAYKAQRLAHLERLRNNCHVPDPVVRAREIAEIDSQIEAVSFGEPAVEAGENLKIERFRK